MLCIFTFHQKDYAPGPSYLTLRSNTDSAILRGGETPWSLLEGTIAGISMKTRGSEENGENQETELLGSKFTSAQAASETLLYEDFLPSVSQQWQKTRT